jgi:hypothetical protein
MEHTATGRRKRDEMSMHAADPSRSQRLARALAFVKSFGSFGCTTAQLQGYTGSMAPATDISELRHAGYLIDCKMDGVKPNGRRVYRYKYLGRKFE